jgi:hypothetical protein
VEDFRDQIDRLLVPEISSLGRTAIDNAGTSRSRLRAVFPVPQEVSFEVVQVIAERDREVLRR